MRSAQRGGPGHLREVRFGLDVAESRRHSARGGLDLLRRQSCRLRRAEPARSPRCDASLRCSSTASFRWPQFSTCWCELAKTLWAIRWRSSSRCACRAPKKPAEFGFLQIRPLTLARDQSGPHHRRCRPVPTDLPEHQGSGQRPHRESARHRGGRFAPLRAQPQSGSRPRGRALQRHA